MFFIYLFSAASLLFVLDVIDSKKHLIYGFEVVPRVLSKEPVQPSVFAWVVTAAFSLWEKPKPAGQRSSELLPSAF